jgi:mannitol/fructose-specific phosphotransferase system IIA component (Ntr-type)
MGVEAYFISAGLILAGFLAFWFYGRKRVRRESALLHLVERLTDRQLVTGSLENELKQIVHERDEIALDRFDRLVEGAPVLDVSEHLSAEAFFRAAALELGPRLGLAPDEMAEMLRRREEEGSTLLGPSLAVPHVVVPGEGRFGLLLARARQGISFSDEAPEVKAVFVLAGTRDERNFHLRALAAIAQIVQEKDFERRWLSATSQQALRDVALLAERRRDGVAI